MSAINPTKITRLIYLVPIFMGLLGGILMYIAVKDRDQQMANDGILCGIMSVIGWTFLGLALHFFVGLNLLRQFPLM